MNKTEAPLRNKLLGQVWTPEWLVERMLNLVEYANEKVLTSKIMEPSFGEGVFFYSIINRIVNAGRSKGLTSEELSHIVDENVYGIEYDEDKHSTAVNHLKQWASEEHNLTLTLPNLYKGDSLSFNFPSQFDFVIGNPPYIRIHNLPLAVRKQLKSLNLSGRGTTDLYVAFFEIALGWLKPAGKLCYVAPNGWLKNPSQQKFREHLHESGWLHLLEDYGQVEVFDESTYTAVALLSKGNPTYTYRRMLSPTQVNHEVVIPRNMTNTKDLTRERTTHAGKTLGDVTKIQNGYATLADRVFILPVGHPLVELCPPELKPVIKGSTYKETQPLIRHMLFPYKQDQTGKWVGLLEEELHPETLQYFREHRAVLEARSRDRGSLWFWFGRSQSIQDIGKEKLSIRALFPSSADNLTSGVVMAGTGLYGGLYATETVRPLSHIREIVESEDFAKYAKSVGVDKRGGYKYLSSPMIKSFPL